MKIAFWTVTKGAGNIAREYKEKLKEHLKDYEIDVFTLKKYDVENTIQSGYVRIIVVLLT